MNKEMFHKELQELMVRHQINGFYFTAMSEVGIAASVCNVPEDTETALALMMMQFVQIPEIYSLFYRLMVVKTLESYGKFADENEEKGDNDILNQYAVKGKLKN